MIFQINLIKEMTVLPLPRVALRCVLLFNGKKILFFGSVCGISISLAAFFSDHRLAGAVAAG